MKKSLTHLELCTRQSCLVCIYLSQGLAPSILTPVFLWYLPGCFLLAFLKGCCLSLSPEVFSLHLVPTIWEPPVLSKRVASSTSTLSWSCWIHFKLFFFSSVILLFSASFPSLVLAILLTFWAAHSM